MDLYLHFIQINSEFNQGLADDLYNGEETEDNIKHLWEDEFKVSEPVIDFKIKNNTTYTLAGLMPDDSSFSFEIPDVTIVNCITSEGKEIQFAVSKKLIKKTDVQRGDNESNIYFYLKDSLPIENPMNGIYILESDFPKQLKKREQN